MSSCRFLLILALALVVALPAAGQTKLLRFPDLHGDRVVFAYAGDLWLAPEGGGSARRLTAHPGLEVFPKFSPDGRWIAFTGQYDGDEQVYVMPAAGGVPTQLTFYPANGPLPPRWGFDHQVVGWTPDGTQVLFRSFRDTWDLAESRLYTVPVEGGLPAPLPMPTAGAGAFSPDGGRILYSPYARDFRTWKRYQGGWAQDLYLFDLATYDTVRLTDHPRTDRDPMWIGERMVFASDRDGTLNLYAVGLAGGEPTRLTGSASWDVRWPSADESTGRVVYELGGELEVLDPASGESRRLAITVPDDGLARRPSRVSAAGLIEDVGLSPKGERVLFAARGDIFSAPVENGPTRNLTHSSDAHDKAPAWSPDGSRIAYLSDRSGEEEVWVIAQDGSGDPERVTTDGRVMRYDPIWSPDGTRIAVSDKDGRLSVVTLADRSVAEIADDPRGRISDYTWSPDGGHLAFSRADPSGFRSIWVWSAGDGETRRVTGELFNEFSPTWDPDGDYLFYVADRAFPPQIGSFEFNYVVDRESEIFALALRRDVAHPFPPESDEVTVEKAEESDGEGGDDADDDATTRGKKGERAKPKAPAALSIDFDGLAERVARVPIEAANIAGMAAAPGHLVYLVTGPFYYGRESSQQPAVHLFSREDRETSVLAEGVGRAILSADGKKILVGQGGGWGLYDVKAGGDKTRQAVSTAGLAVDRVPAEEWAQIFDEAWRRFRDWFYVDNLHGYDWQQLGDQYRPLLAHVAHRSDLNYLIGEMIAELNVSHAYIAGGDFDLPPRPPVALPGARFALDAEAGRYRISELLPGHNEEELYRSPLTEIGVDAAAGDYLLAIDGVEVGPRDNPYRLLRHKADRPVELTLNDRPTLEGARRATFRPRTDEGPLVYLRWVLDKRRRVEEATDGRVGYLHLPDMGADGIREFIKWYYGQIDRDGLIVDVRGNGGGNVSQMIIGRLARELLGFTYDRTDDHPETYPNVVFRGPMACLISATSASDGDIFPYMFRKAGLGPLIGKRTWGGVIGISTRGPLLDGGDVFVPESGQVSPEGRWVIEGRGVEPDIEVDNPPRAEIEGRDPQLERAIAEVMAALADQAPPRPPRPPAPVRTKERFDEPSG